MKKLLLGLMIVFSMSSVFAQSVGSYADLKKAMQAGEYFIILSDFNKCSGNSNLPIGYFTPNAILLVDEGLKTEHIATSDLHFTAATTGQPIYEYIRYTFNPDGSVVIQSSNYTPADFKPTGTPYTFNCTLAKSVTVTAGTLTTPHE